MQRTTNNVEKWDEKLKKFIFQSPYLKQEIFVRIQKDQRDNRVEFAIQLRGHRFIQTITTSRKN